MNPSPRRIKALPITLTIPASVKPDYRAKLEATAHACPVAKSLHPDIEVKIEFKYV